MGVLASEYGNVVNQQFRLVAKRQRWGIDGPYSSVARIWMEELWKDWPVCRACGKRLSSVVRLRLDQCASRHLHAVWSSLGLECSRGQGFIHKIEYRAIHTSIPREDQFMCSRNAIEARTQRQLCTTVACQMCAITSRTQNPLTQPLGERT